MQKQSYLEKLKSAPVSSFHVLDEAKAKKMKAHTMYMPSPLDVAKAIASIPEGETRTIIDLRRELAILGHADTTCPVVTIKYWKWLAYAYEEAKAGDPEYAVPWWRVLKDGKPSRHMPGGIEGQISLLQDEGTEVK